ncbi:GxxExxY protein [Puniceicoccales bacterium CK1056]|uniref:GxxExxY protein n=1 Tax=Oceanipulchritudo coccoides TaxID=2706888 RepID=A0A6B2M611_9BACT|nr:GxxExxY protein [Oceanipulchritudo coccoides]NDV63587.1 GxxExxY protein [Oceanipulchritudo coccoides]
MPLIYKEESFKIVGACFEVYNLQGHGFLEAVYQECLEIEFRKRGIPFESQISLRLQYKDCHLRHRYIADFLCFESVIVEIKAHKELAKEHRAQTINYLKSTGFQLGILINFGNPRKLEYERFLNLKNDKKNSCNS